MHKNPMKAAAESETENQNVQTSFSASAKRSGESPSSSRFTSWNKDKKTQAGELERPLFYRTSRV